LPDGKTIEIFAEFAPGRIEQKSGEAIVFLTQGAERKGDLTSFAFEDVTVNMAVPPNISVSFFVKDDTWQSAYWHLAKSDNADWQRLSLTAQMPPTHQDRHFDDRRCVAVGWQFHTETYEGPLQIRLKDARLVLRPTNLVQPVERWPRDKFMQACGVDVVEAYDELQQGVPDGVIAPADQWRSWLDWVAAYNVRLVRVPVFGNLDTGAEFTDTFELAGLDAAVLTAMDRLLVEMARHPEMSLLPVLFNGSLAQRWPNLITNPAERRALCQRVVCPFLERYKESQGVYGVEILANSETVVDELGDQPVRDFVGEVLATVRSLDLPWPLLCGHSSRRGLSRLQLSGLDGYTFCYDPANERHDVLKSRRDDLPFPPRETPVILVAKLPPVDRPEDDAKRPPFASYAIQDAFDYGYAGIMFSGFAASPHRRFFRDREADAVAAWMARDTAAGSINGV
jgi:hypothetical protein